MVAERLAGLSAHDLHHVAGSADFLTSDGLREGILAQRLVELDPQRAFSAWLVLFQVDARHLAAVHVRGDVRRQSGDQCIPAFVRRAVVVLRRGLRGCRLTGRRYLSGGRCLSGGRRGTGLRIRCCRRFRHSGRFRLECAIRLGAGGSAR